MDYIEKKGRIVLFVTFDQWYTDHLLLCISGIHFSVDGEFLPSQVY